MSSASLASASNGRSSSDKTKLFETKKSSSSGETRNPLRYQPRSLTEEEIEDIVSVIEPIPSAVPSTGKHTQEEIKNVLRRQLESIELVPQAIPEMKQTIKYQFRRSIIEPQSPVGFLVSEALSAPITQMTLNSVIGETEIVICDKDTKQAKVVQIGAWIDELLQQNKEKIVNIPENRTEYLELEKPVLIPSTTCDGKSEWMELTAVTRHLPVGDLVKIKTRSGREVTATSQKSFLVYDEKEDKLKEKDGKHLKIGDYVGIHLELEHEVINDVLNLETYLSKQEYMYGSEFNKFVDLYTRDKVGRQVPKDWWKTHRGSSFVLPFSEKRHDSIIKSMEFNSFESGMIYPKISTLVKNKIPEKFILDRELGFVFGIYLAEGHANKTTVIISNNAPEMLEPVKNWCDKLQVGYHVQIQHDKNFKGSTSTDLRIHSTLLASLFTKMMGTGSPNKRIPDESLNGPKDFIKGILDGYISGDGYVLKDGSIGASSVSKTLIVGISFLLQRLGIMNKVSGNQAKKNNIGSKVILYTHTLNIRNGFAKRFADQISLTCNKKQERLNHITNTKKFKKENGVYYHDYNEIMLDPIITISNIESNQCSVYDVTVPKSLNFNLFNGLIMAD
jgi:intein/homing endonuclease